MPLSPAGVRHVELGRGVLGYKRTAVDELLEEVVASFEQVWRERADLADKTEQLEADLERYRELETLLRTTLVSAERATQDMRDKAQKEAELVVSEARTEARVITQAARAELDHLRAETHRIRTVLSAALETITAETSSAEAA